ncbi:translocation and assembly module protein TamB, partial [Paraburkholderia sp. BR14261]
GAVSAEAKLDGVRPFALTGDLGYSGKVNGEDVQVSANLAGSLEALTADVEASGMKLTGRAHVEATPFAAVPLQRVTLAFDHVNPQAFAPGAPFADLAVRAQLQPVPGGAAGVPAALAAVASGAAAVSGVTPASVPALASAPAGGAMPDAARARSNVAGFTVAGAVSIVNAKPGAIDEKLLPLIDAHADVVL